MICLEDELCKLLDPYTLVCPSCGATHCLVRHGAYRRTAVRIVLGVVRAVLVVVCRLRCKRCGRTHAVLPSSLVAGSCLSVEVCMLVLVMCEMAARDAEVAARLGVRLCDVARARNDADRVAALVAESALGLAWDLAALADDPTFPARFLAVHGTTPFSRLAAHAPSWSVGAACTHAPPG